MKKVSCLFLIVVIIFAMGAAAEATNNSETELTPEQLAVIGSYVYGVEDEDMDDCFGHHAAGVASSRFRVTRGAKPVMWCENTVDWSYTTESISSSRITSSSAYQDAGSIFPYIATKDGITKYASTTDSVTYRGACTFGEGVPTKYGYAALYTTSYSNFIRGFTFGNVSWW